MQEKKYWKKTIFYIFLLTAVIVVGAILLIPLYWPIGLIIWLFVPSGVALFLLVRWHAKSTAYICPKCGHTFMISTTKDFLRPHLIDKKLLRCPKCGEKSWCEAVSVESLGEKTSFEKSEQDQNIS